MLQKSSPRPLQALLPVLPPAVRLLLAALPEEILDQVEEIRLRQERPLALTLAAGDVFLDGNGKPVSEPGRAYRVSADDMGRLVQLISASSIYAFEEELRNGFITLPGGYRAGVCGKAVLEGGRVKTLKYLSSCNIRIFREIPGAADRILPFLIDRARRTVCHTVLVSPPRCGKTTMLRDLVRQVSNGVPALGLAGVNVGLVDERSEIAGCYLGVPQRDVGVRTDVLDGCPKAEGLLVLLRSMGPQVVATDEIGRKEDIAAIEEVLNAGVKVLATVHGASLEELSLRPALAYLIKSRTVERFVILGRSQGVGTVEAIIDGKTLQPLEVKGC
ncbi:MAG: stage III sporulation protein AA [Firmicutes bacterium]|nr:stage III sporulation protein AA [Bacillota bacterium]